MIQSSQCSDCGKRDFCPANRTILVGLDPLVDARMMVRMVTRGQNRDEGTRVKAAEADGTIRVLDAKSQATIAMRVLVVVITAIVMMMLLGIRG